VLLDKFRNQDDRFVTDALSKADQQVKRMTNLINGFLNVSRLESGKINLEKQEFLLNDLMKDIIDETRIMVKSHELILLAGNAVFVHADRDKIGSVITNLVSNAIKYSPKGKKVQLACQQEGNYVKVMVEDEGIGIKKEDQEKLFERYYRVENNQARYISGFGIGLYLSSEIIHRHHGRIGVESTPGTGSTFWFTLPL
jgi:signal transduction histidine kinase